jgi:hypothetical protein
MFFAQGVPEQIVVKYKGYHSVIICTFGAFRLTEKRKTR